MIALNMTQAKKTTAAASGAANQPEGTARNRIHFVPAVMLLEAAARLATGYYGTGNGTYLLRYLL